MSFRSCVLSRRFPMSVRIPPQLLQAVQDRRAVIFAGAGISREALGNVGGASVAKALIDEIQAQSPHYDGTGRNFEEICDEYAALNDKITLVNKLADLIPHSASPSP